MHEDLSFWHGKREVEVKGHYPSGGIVPEGRRVDLRNIAPMILTVYVDHKPIGTMPYDQHEEHTDTVKRAKDLVDEKLGPEN